MVDNRAAGFYGIGGSFNFKSGDISGTAAKTQDDKMGQGGEYFANRGNESEEETQQQNPYMDRSAALRATLNSLAMMNVANVINNRKKSILDDKKDKKVEKKKEELEKLLSQNSMDENKDFQDNEYN